MLELAFNLKRKEMIALMTMHDRVYHSTMRAATFLIQRQSYRDAPRCYNLMCLVCDWQDPTGKESDGQQDPTVEPAI